MRHFYNLLPSDVRDTSNSFKYFESRWAGLQKDSQASAVAFLESLDQVQINGVYWKTSDKVPRLTSDDLLGQYAIDMISGSY